MPPLDGGPPSPPGVPAGPPKDASFSAMTPTQDTTVDSSGSLQLVQMALETGSAVAKGLQLLGQLLPGFAPVAAQLDLQLRGGLKAALQQGLSPSTETPPIPQFDQLGQQAAMGGGGSMAPMSGGLNG